MIENPVLYIPTVLSIPFELEDIIYPCPVCDYEINIDLIVTENSYLECAVCDQKIKIEVKKID